MVACRRAIFAGSALLLAVVGISVELIAAFLPGVVLPLSATATSAYLVVNPFLAFAVVRYGLLQLSPAAAVSAIMDMMSESVILTDQQGAIQFLNPAARALLGRPPLGVAPPFLGGLLLRRESGDGRPLSYEDLRNGGKGLRDRECLLEVEGRAPLPVSVSSTVLESSRWGESGLIITLRDVSERRKMEVLRDSAERIMRHDLRNTLTGIFTSSSALAREPSLGPAARENAALIHDGARLLNEQIDAYLYLRAVEDGAFKAPLEEVDLIEVLREVLRNQVALADSLKVHVVLRVDGGPAGSTDAVRVRGIHAMLFGVFVNLVKNAIEASPFGSEVSVQVASAKPGHRFRAQPGRHSPGDSPALLHEIRDGGQASWHRARRLRGAHHGRGARVHRHVQHQRGSGNGNRRPLCRGNPALGGSVWQPPGAALVRCSRTDRTGSGRNGRTEKRR